MKNSHVSIVVNHDVQVMVLLHRVWKKNPINVDFLGVYIPNENRYSPLVHGLIGQFSREPEVSVHDVREGVDPLKKEAIMEVKGNQLLVTRYASTTPKYGHTCFYLNCNRVCVCSRGWQKDYRHDKRRGSSIYCWFIHNNGKGFIDGHYTDYIVPEPRSFLRPPETRSGSL